MVRGKGIDGWPYGRSLPAGPLNIADGFVRRVRLRPAETFGVKPIVWAELYASLDLLIGAKPPTLAGFGRAGGSLQPRAVLARRRGAGQLHGARGASYFWAEVTGRIELLFFDIEGTVTISFGDEHPR